MEAMDENKVEKHAAAKITDPVTLKELFLKLISLIPESDGKEFEKEGLLWSLYRPDDGGPVLCVRFAGLEVRIMVQDEDVTWK